MPGAAPLTINIPGINFARDIRQLTAPRVIDGQNVEMTGKGPKSGYAENLVSEARITDPENLEFFVIDDASYIFGTGVILKYDATTQRYYPIFQFTDTDQVFPWSMAHIGAKYYFAKLGVAGVIRYTPSTGLWELRTNSDDANIPTAPYSVMDSYGRLVILSNLLVQWSALDAGDDLATSAITGAGSQSLAVIGQGAPLGLASIDAGFTVFTKTGAALFTAVEATIPFRYKKIETTDFPINPYVIKGLQQGIVVYLAKTGFKLIQEDKALPWQPLVSEEFTQNILRDLDLTLQSIVRFAYSASRQWLIVSLALPVTPALYYKAFVCYLPLLEEGWGVFNRSHYAFGQVDTTVDASTSFNFGFSCNGGLIRKLVDVPHREESALSYGYDRHWRPNLAIPVQLGSVNRFSTMARLDADDFNNLLTSNAGVYTESPVDTWTLVERSFISINSFADIGPYRLSDETFHDRLSEVLGVAVHTNLVAEFEFLDYNDTDEPDEDWGNVSVITYEDWGTDVLSDNVFSAILTGTLDGETAYNDNQKTLTAATTQGKVTHYQPSGVLGIYHRLRLSATGSNESFHLNTLEISAILAGRL